MKCIVKSLDNKMESMSIFIDVSKAFDSVHHSFLLTLLIDIGVRGTPLKWSKIYLSYRSQIVSISNKMSDSIELKIEVP